MGVAVVETELLIIITAYSARAGFEKTPTFLSDWPWRI